MATKYGTGATKIYSNSPPSLAEQGELSGKIKVHYDEYALSGALSSGDVIYFGGKIPAGARVLDVVLDSPDLDSSSTGALTSGWLASDELTSGSPTVAADDDGFLTTVDVHTAGKAQSMSALLASNVPGKFKKFAAAVQPAVKITGAMDATTGTIRQAIYFVTE